ncbi:MAG TPA: GNAT family N-acetyltransferase [Caulobacteraceae bacterium]|nr:GNAT family N-acetyltransferase [Caulobacteraceae bacterium]
MSGVTIRSARADDVPRLAAIEASGADTFAAHGLGHLLADGSPPASDGHWAAALEAGLIWIADDADRGPIGFLAGELADDGLYIAEVDVVMDRQRQGYGRRLLAAAIDWARARGLTNVTLTTFRHIPWNAPFYARLGFRELGAAEMPPHLAAALASEGARGFEDRCGMRLAL